MDSDPMFVNASGNMNQLENFRLSENSPCNGGGRDGGDIGADIDSVGTGHIHVDAPATPKALKIVKE